MEFLNIIGALSNLIIEIIKLIYKKISEINKKDITIPMSGLKCLYKKSKSPKKLVGRNKLIRKVNKSLNKNDVLFVTGGFGIGKSAVCCAVMNKLSRSKRKHLLLEFDFAKCPDFSYNSFLSHMEYCLDITYESYVNPEKRKEEIIEKLIELINYQQKCYIFFNHFQLPDEIAGIARFINEIVEKDLPFKILVSMHDGNVPKTATEIAVPLLDKNNSRKLFRNSVNPNLHIKEKEIKKFFNNNAGYRPMTITTMVKLFRQKGINNFNDIINLGLEALNDNYLRSDEYINTLYDNYASREKYCNFISYIFSFYSSAADVDFLSKIISINESREESDVQKDVRKTLDSMTHRGFINMEGDYSNITLVSCIKSAYYDFSKGISEGKEGSLSYYHTYLSNYFVSLLEKNNDSIYFLKCTKNYINIPKASDISESYKAVTDNIRSIITLLNQLVNTKNCKLFIRIHELMFPFYNYFSNDAIDLLEKAIKIKGLFDENCELKIRTILEIANCYDYGDHDKAIEYYSKASQLAKKYGNEQRQAEILKREADCRIKRHYEVQDMHYKAYLTAKKPVNKNQKEYDVHLFVEYEKLCENFAGNIEEPEEKSKFLENRLSSFGKINEVYNMYYKAYLSAKKLVKENPTKDVEVMRLYAEICKSFADIHKPNPEDSFELLKTALRYFNKAYFPCGIGYTRRALGYCYLYSLSQPEKAKQQFDEAMKIGKMEQRTNAIAETYECLANYYQQINDTRNTEVNLIEADKYFSETFCKIQHYNCLKKLLFYYDGQNRKAEIKETLIKLRNILTVRKIYDVPDQMHWGEAEKIKEMGKKLGVEFP